MQQAPKLNSWLTVVVIGLLQKVQFNAIGLVLNIFGFTIAAYCGWFTTIVYGIPFEGTAFAIGCPYCCCGCGPDESLLLVLGSGIAL